jgi:putative hydrolase of the HAD superfamily
MPIKAVVFDIGGVLEVNPRTGWQNRWAARLGLDPGEFGRRLGRIWGPGSIGAADLAEIERQTAVAFGLDRVGLAELMDDAWREYVGTLNAELAAYFAGLRVRFRTGILSNSFVGAREREHAYGFEAMCDVLIYSHEVGCMKPEPRIYHVVCERLGVLPAETAFLDDVQANVDGARAIGMRAITFAHNRQAIAELQQMLAS